MSMSGERVNVIKGRATAFLDLAIELIRRGKLDIASFNIHQACQLRIKATLLRITGEMPRLHGIRELLGILAKEVEELGYPEISKNIVSFVRQNRDALIDIETSYTESRYGLAVTTRTSIEEMVKAAKALFNLLEEVEKDVMG